MPEKVGSCYPRKKCYKISINCMAEKNPIPTTPLLNPCDECYYASDVSASSCIISSETPVICRGESSSSSGLWGFFSFPFEFRDIYVSPKGQKILTVFYSLEIFFFIVVFALRHSDLSCLSLGLRKKFNDWIVYFNFILLIFLFLEIITRSISGHLPFDKPWILFSDSLLFISSISVLTINRSFFLASGSSTLDFCLFWNVIRNCLRLAIVVYLLYSITDVKLVSSQRKMSEPGIWTNQLFSKSMPFADLFFDESREDYIGLPID